MQPAERIVEPFKSFSKHRIGGVQEWCNDFNRMETEQSENVHLNYSNSPVWTNIHRTTWPTGTAQYEHNFDTKGICRVKFILFCFVS